MSWRRVKRQRDRESAWLLFWTVVAVVLVVVATVAGEMTTVTDERPAKPIAWMVVESHRDGSSPRVMTGRLWVNEGAARVAAKRMCNDQWLRLAVPVFAPTAEQLAGLKR